MEPAFHDRISDYGEGGDAEKDETLEHACREAVKQIKDKRYAEALDGFRTVLSYGIAFKGKDCMIRQCAD